MSPGLRLSALAAAIDTAVTPSATVDNDPVVIDVTHDHRQVRPGSLFCCIVGASHDGHDHAAEAVALGAVALLCERPLAVGVPEIVVGDSRAAAGPIAAAAWGDPSKRLTVVGVTGTNGKTTVVTLVAQLLTSLGVHAEIIGTLTGVRTTPESTDLQRALAVMADHGTEVVAMEVSSHALSLGRVNGTHFEVAAFTNLGTDHLDFHGTPERYFEAKAALFEPRRCDVAVINIDDVHGRLLSETIALAGEPGLVRVSADGSDIELGPAVTRFTWHGTTVALPLRGRFNVTNALIAAEILVALGHPRPAVASALTGVAAPAGRFESVDRGQDFVVLVDFAHTPDALDVVLEAAAELTGPEGRLIVVFGAGGDRDRAKRPQMGEVVSRNADVVIVTSDNPRSELPSTIMAAVAEGCREVEPILIEDRREAIAAAIEAARPGDVIVIAGKGHETTQTIGDRVEPFDDRVVAAELLEAIRP